MNTRRLFVFLLPILILALVTTPIGIPDRVLAQGEGTWPRTIVDGGGNEVTIAAPPQRIASVTLASDEMLFSLVEPERLIGVTTMAVDPGISNVAALATQIPNRLTADPELLISLEPDLVIVATWTDPAVVEQLRGAGLTVFMMPLPVGIQPIRDAVTLLGQVTGEEDRAAELVAGMDARLEAVAQAVSAVETPLRTLYLTPGNYTSGSPSTIAEVIAAAGGVDIAAEAGVSQFDPLSDEFILEQDPDVILLSGWTPWEPTFVETFRSNPVYQGLTAVQNGRVYVVNDAHLSTTSQYIVEGVEDVAALLYPGHYPAYPMTITDGVGNTVTLDSRPETLASLTLGTDEILAGLLADEPERIVGLTYLVDDPSISSLAGEGILNAFTTTRVEADPEQIIDLDPDLLFAATFTDAAVLSQLREAGVTVVQVGDFTSVAAMLDNIAFVGNLIGERTAAQTLIGQLTDRLEAVTAVVSAVEEPRTVIYLSTDNWIAGCATTLDDVIRLAGGINAACVTAGLNDWQQIDAETLIALDPDVIVLSSWVDANAFVADPALVGLTAIREENVIVGNDAHLSAVSQYIVAGVEDMARYLYPDLFPAE